MSESMSQEELCKLIYKNINSWVNEEMKLNPDSAVTHNERVCETIDSFVRELGEYLPFREYKENQELVPAYKEHVFISFDVDFIREYMSEDFDASDYPKLMAMTNDDLDEHLRRCASKGYVIWNDDGGIDLYELQNLIRE